MNCGRYIVREIMPDTYVIEDFGFGFVSSLMYLLVGGERALLIDSGYGGLELAAIAGELTDRPIDCACTHGHLDHALGASRFERGYLHSLDYKLYEQHSSATFLAARASSGIGRCNDMPVDDPLYRANAQKIISAPHRPLEPLEAVECFELGGRNVTWRLMPGHTAGCAVFFDCKNNAVFEGDAACDCAWLFLPESLRFGAFMENLAEYREWCGEMGVERRWLGHSPTAAPLAGLDALARAGRAVQAGCARVVSEQLTLGETMSADVASYEGSTIYFDRSRL